MKLTHPFFQLLVFLFYCLITFFMSLICASLFQLDIKINQLISSLLLMIVTPSLFLITYRNKAIEKRYISLKQNAKDYMYVLCLLIVSIPIIHLITMWNLSWNLEWMGRFGETLKQAYMQYDKTVEAIIEANGWMEKLLVVFIVVIIPAVGEELFFRGILQSVCLNITGRILSANLVTSFIFTLIHFDVYGLVPRFVISLLLGYIYYYKRNLLLTILWHLINNAIVLFISWEYGTSELQIDSFSDNLVLFITMVAFSVLTSVWLLRKWVT